MGTSLRMVLNRISEPPGAPDSGTPFLGQHSLALAFLKVGQHEVHFVGIDLSLAAHRHLAK